MNATRLASRVLLIGWDGADWNLIHPLLDSGQMPHLARLVETGVIANLATLQPCLSPMLWTSIATGKTADQHGICGFLEPQPDGAGVRPVASTSRRTKALWNILSQQGLRSAVIGWQVSHPAEPIRGVCVSDRFADIPPVPAWGIKASTPPAEPVESVSPEPTPGPANGGPPRAWPVLGDSVHPHHLLPALASLRVHPTEIHPHDLTPLIPQVQAIDPGKDPRPAELARLLARAGSVQAAATAVLESEPWDLLAVYFDTLDLAGHQFMPYHPPRLPHVPITDFEHYHDVINALYRFHDQMLGRLLELAGPDTTVMLVSDHGFHSDHRRPHILPSGPVPEPQAAAWHRPYGIFVLNGPPVLADRRAYGATLLDITPTVLTLFGLPIGRDMDGRPLLEALNRPVTPAYLESWDTKPGDDGQHPRAYRQDPFESAALVQHFIDLGYLPAATADANRAVAVVTAEAQFNLATVHLHHGRPQAAQPLLEALHATWPNQPRFALCLAKCYADQARHRECRRLIEGLESRGVREAEGDLLLAAALFNEGEPDAALTRLTEAQHRHADDPLVCQLVGDLFRAQHRWHDARPAYARTLELAPDHAAAHQGLAAVCYELGQWDQSIDHALQAAGLRFFAPQTHYFLGMALARKGDTERAIAALQTAVAQAPRFGEAHYHLMRLYESLGRLGEALHHRELAFGQRPQLMSPHAPLAKPVVTQPPPPELVRERTHAAQGLPAVQLTSRALADLVCLATGVFAPLKRFMTAADYARVLAEMRCADGTLFPLPLTLDLDARALPKRGDRLALRDEGNELVAILTLVETFPRDPVEEAKAILGTCDPRHPFVAERSQAGTICVSGAIELVALPRPSDFAELWLMPSAARQHWANLGHSRVVAFCAREPLHRGHEALLRQTAGRLKAGLLLDPGTGWPRAGDLTPYIQLRLCRALAARCLDSDRTLVTAMPLAARWAGPREALWQALAYRNHGATHFLVADHHADPGQDSRGRPYHAAQAARELVDQFAPETGITAVPAPEFAYLPVEDRYVERASAPPAATPCPLSSRALVDEYLDRGRPVPAWFVRPEAAALLETIHPPRSRQGFCVWLTGLSGAGKSATARCLTSVLMACGRAVTLLDGDAVRAKLSAGLGFSRADRDANIRRIGFVAAEIVRHHGAVICAAVSPYRATRGEVRSLVGTDRFFEVFVDTPMAVCEARDTKGLYARARRGELTGFTGVNDPYEPPATPELRLDTITRSVEDNARAILTLLESRGFVARRRSSGNL